MDTLLYSRIEKSPSMAWCKPGEKGPEKANIGKLVDKLMAIVVQVSQGVLLTYYIPKRANVNSVYYCKVLCKLKSNIYRKWFDLRMSRFSSYTIMSIHILLSSQWHSSTSLVGLFFCIRLIRLILHPMIFSYHGNSKDSPGGQHFANDLLVKQAIANFSVTVQRAFTLQEFNVLQIDTKKFSILMVIMLKNILSHVEFVVSFSQQLVHTSLHYAVGIFTFRMTLVVQFCRGFAKL